MSALYFSRIAFAAHKKHGGFGICPAGHRVTSQIVLAHGRHLSCSCGAADKRRPALRKDLGGNPVPGLRLLWGLFRSCGEIGTVLAVKSPHQSLFHRNLYWGSLLRNLDWDFRFTVELDGWFQACWRLIWFVLIVVLSLLMRLSFAWNAGLRLTGHRLCPQPALRLRRHL